MTEDWQTGFAGGRDPYVKPAAEPPKMEWCRVGPEGQGFFWGSHGCTLGDHAGRDPHVHECQNAEFDDDGEIVAVVPCVQYDDRTDQVRWHYVDTPPDEFSEWKPWSGKGWWQ